MANGKKKKFYAVKNGRSIGIFKSWDECKNSVNGYPGAIYQGFQTESDAIKFCGNNLTNITDSKMITNTNMNTNTTKNSNAHVNSNIDTKQSPSLSPSHSYYAVRSGYSVGIFESWSQCKASVDGYNGCKFKKFRLLGDAESYMASVGNDTGSAGVNSPIPSISNQLGSISDSDSDSDSYSTPTSTSTTNPTSIASKDVFILTRDQHAAIQLILGGRSAFVTGAAGTGKSFVVQVVQQLSKVRSQSQSQSYSQSSVWNTRGAFTASTGCAACHIAGQTLHMWSGIGGFDIVSGGVPLSVVVGKMSVQAVKRWRQTQLLLIDEISMISAQFFDQLSQVGSLVRGDEAPFGGLQVVCVGDFLQLPPVVKEIDGLVSNSGSSSNKGSLYCFNSQVWKQLFGTSTSTKPTTGSVVVLKQIIRQKDESFCRILN